MKQKKTKEKIFSMGNNEEFTLESTKALSGRREKIEDQVWMLEKLDRLYECFAAELGKHTAKRIFEIIMQKLGDDRISISFAYY